MGKPLENYTPQWEQIRRTWRLMVLSEVAILTAFITLFVGLVVFASTIQLPGWAIVSLFMGYFGLVIGLAVINLILRVKYSYWRCPRCGDFYFGLTKIRDVGWWRLESCVHCGLFVDAPNATSCPDRRLSGRNN
jgi:hypothetical protein